MSVYNFIAIVIRQIIPARDGFLPILNCLWLFAVKNCSYYFTIHKLCIWHFLHWANTVFYITHITNIRFIISQVKFECNTQHKWPHRWCFKMFLKSPVVYAAYILVADSLTSVDVRGQELAFFAVTVICFLVSLLWCSILSCNNLCFWSLEELCCMKSIYCGINPDVKQKHLPLPLEKTLRATSA